MPLANGTGIGIPFVANPAITGSGTPSDANFQLEDDTDFLLEDGTNLKTE